MATRVTPESQHARPTSATRPPERAQLVWRRALELADPLAQHDRFVLAMDLLRAAHHDSATMTHALSLGRTQLRSNPGDAVALRGVKVLKAAIVLLGVKPSTGDIRSIK
jgi:hypothetical protein